MNAVVFLIYSSRSLVFLLIAQVHLRKITRLFCYFTIICEDSFFFVVNFHFYSFTEKVPVCHYSIRFSVILFLTPFCS
jgi:hypothetical protein